MPYWRIEDRFHAPTEMRPSQDAAAVSGACPLLEGQAVPELLAKFGWDKPPPVRMLVKQIEKLQSKVSWKLWLLPLLTGPSWKTAKKTL